MARFSERWWRGHHMTRDACGSWTPTGTAGGECRREDGQQGSRRLRRQLKREGAAADRARKQRAASSKAGRGTGSSRAELRTATYEAQVNQESRAEAAGANAPSRRKVSEERQRFFETAQQGERKVTQRAADVEASRRRAADREAAAEYRAAARTRKPDKWTERQAARARAAAAADGW